MTFDTFQSESARTRPQTLSPREQVLVFALGLAGESGEVCDLIKKWARQGPDATLDSLEVKHEIGDVLWYVAQLALACGLSLEDVAMGNLDKLRRRYPGGFTPDGGVR
jgi:NTP pyrophosphatase (non-canonical NTP hydrolase)